MGAVNTNYAISIVFSDFSTRYHSVIYHFSAAFFFFVHTIHIFPFLFLRKEKIAEFAKRLYNRNTLILGGLV